MSRISNRKLFEIVYKTELLITVAASSRNHKVLNSFSTTIADSNPAEDMNLGQCPNFSVLISASKCLEVDRSAVKVSYQIYT